MVMCDYERNDEVGKMMCLRHTISCPKCGILTSINRPWCPNCGMDWVWSKDGEGCISCENLRRKEVAHGHREK